MTSSKMKKTSKSDVRMPPCHCYRTTSTSTFSPDNPGTHPGYTYRIASCPCYCCSLSGMESGWSVHSTSWWSRPSRPAVLYPGPGSGRSRRWDPTNSVGDHERGWPPAGGLRAGAREDSSRGLVLRLTVLRRTPLHGCLLSSEARILRLQGAS